MLVSRVGAMVKDYVLKDVPSDIIPFEGDFPIVKPWHQEEFLDLIKNTQYTEQLPIKYQQAIILGLKIYNVDHNFRMHLREQNIDVYDYEDWKDEDKKEYFEKWMYDVGMDLDRLKIGFEYGKYYNLYHGSE